MSISNINPSPVQQVFPEGKAETEFIDKQISKLQEELRKIREDANKKSNNSDSKVARGEQDANRDANNKIAQQLEMQITNLQNRKNAMANRHQNSSSINASSTVSQKSLKGQLQQSDESNGRELNNNQNQSSDSKKTDNSTGQIVDTYA